MRNKKEVNMLKKGLLISFFILIFPVILKGLEGWKEITPVESYSYLLQFISENLQAIRFDTDGHRNEYNAELQTTINLAQQGNLEAVKERVNQIHIPHAQEWITSSVQKEIILVLLKGQALLSEGIWLESGIMEKIKEAIENETAIAFAIVHPADGSTMKLNNGTIVHLRDCSLIIAQ